MSYKPFLLSTARGAGAILMKYFNKKHKIEKKAGAGIVTEADKAAEAYCLKKIRAKYPKASIIAEESGEMLKDDKLCFIIDPLDGTSNYAHGFPWFCVSIGIHVNGKAAAGVVYNPVNKELFFAEKGKGAFLNGKRIRVSKTGAMDDALLGTGFYYSKGDPLREEVEIFRRINEATLAVRRPGAAALDLAYVACGRYDGFWERGLSSWDVAAGYLLVEEAGGLVTNYRNAPTTPYNKETVATNGPLHASLIRLIQGN